MIQFQQYVGRVNGLRGSFGGLPQWARTVVGIFAIPGLLLMALSIVVFVVSILALLLLTIPAYSLLGRLTGTFGSRSVGTMPANVGFAPAIDLGSMFSSPESGAKRVSATVVDPSSD